MSVYQLFSPNRRVCLSLLWEEAEGRLYYRTTVDGHEAVGRAPLGLVTNTCDFTCGVAVTGQTRSAIQENYTLPAFKKERCDNRANCLTLTLEKEGECLLAEAIAYDDGAAVRLTLPGEGPVQVLREATGYAFLESAASLYAQKLLFSYEDNYHPVPVEDLYQNAYAFPLLAQLSGSYWALYAEAPVFAGAYGGSNLLSTPENPRLLQIRRAPDQLEPLSGTRPFSTPWRAAVVGSLNDIVASNLLENLNPPSILSDASFVRAGRCAWSWMVENDSPKDPQRQKEYIDYAAKMGFEYSLIDGGWPGHVDIPEMVAYAAQRNVKIWIWEHCARMRDPVEAEEKLRLWSSWGVAGIKIDFFESDSQQRIAQYAMLAELAARYHLMLNFHGCSKPTGSIRVWPHVLSYEGVMGGEYLQNFSSFLPGGPDAAHNCTLPFTRNAVGPMDYTPIIYRSYLTGTTDCHQTALSVVFSSYILHVAEKPEVVLENPCAPFLRQVPACWDETRLLEGFPANYVTMARRKGEDWFVGAICARRPRNSHLCLDFLGEGNYTAELYADDLSGDRPFDAAVGALPGPTPELCKELEASMSRPALHQHDLHAVRTEVFTVRRGQTLTIPLSVNGGYVLRLTPAKA